MLDRQGLAGGSGFFRRDLRGLAVRQFFFGGFPSGMWEGSPQARRSCSIERTALLRSAQLSSVSVRSAPLRSAPLRSARRRSAPSGSLWPDSPRADTRSLGMPPSDPPHA